ncbi:MAG: hypothetical protein AN485_23925, partial [Anabaena sp. MDT14b]
LHVAKEDQHLDGLHVRAGGDHVHGDGDARVIVVAERADELFRVRAIGAVGDLLGEVIALAEHLAHGADDLLCVVIVLGEDQRLRHFPAARKQLSEQRVAIGFQHRADLVRHQHRAVALIGRVGEILRQRLRPAERRVGTESREAWRPHR